MSSVSTLVALNCRDRKISSGTIGARTRSSTSTNAMRATMPTTSAPSTTGDVQLPAVPWIKPNEIPTSASDRQRAAGDVDVAGRLRVARFRDVAERDPDHCNRDRRIDQEDQPPGDCGDEESADKGSERGRHASKTRPGPDDAPALARRERRLEDREAPRSEQRAADTLERACGDQELDARRRRADQRGNGEPCDADHEQTAASKSVRRARLTAGSTPRVRGGSRRRPIAARRCPRGSPSRSPVARSRRHCRPGLPWNCRGPSRRGPTCRAPWRGAGLQPR